MNQKNIYTPKVDATHPGEVDKPFTVGVYYFTK